MTGVQQSLPAQARLRPVFIAFAHAVDRGSTNICFWDSRERPARSGRSAHARISART